MSSYIQIPVAAAHGNCGLGNEGCPKISANKLLIINQELPMFLNFSLFTLCLDIIGKYFLINWLVDGKKKSWHFLDDCILFAEYCLSSAHTIYNLLTSRLHRHNKSFDYQYHIALSSNKLNLLNASIEILNQFH